MHRVALLLDPNNLQHSEILELIQNKVVVKDARRLLHVGFDAADTPDVGALEHLHLMLTPHIFTQQGEIGPVDTAALCSAVT